VWFSEVSTIDQPHHQSPPIYKITPLFAGIGFDTSSKFKIFAIARGMWAVVLSEKWIVDVEGRS